MISVRIGGVWLHSIGAHAELTVSHAWPHGSDEVTWVMQDGTSHPALHRGALVEVFDGGVPIWRGRLTEPSESGKFAARGLWTEAEGVWALSLGGAATNDPDAAIDAAVFRGALSWVRNTSLLGTAWGTVGEPLDLLKLLDEAMAGLGLRWLVDPLGEVRAAGDPTIPAYVIPHAVAGHGLTLADDAYYSHLVGTYLVSTPPDVFATVTVGDAAAVARWGRKEGLVDLTPMGPISAGTATTQLNNRLALVGGRMGFAEDLELGVGQITTLGGSSVALTMPRAGEMVRLMGVTDQTRPTGDLPMTDIVIAKSSYTEGAGVVRLSPMGKAPRNLAGILEVAVA